MLATETSLLTSALALAGRGFHIFPLRPGDKRPALRSDWEGRANTDPARIQTCWYTGAFNIGIACGPSRLLVIDLDTPKPNTPPPPPPFNQEGVNDGADALALLADRLGECFPFDTLTVTTGRGGQHLYFTRPQSAQLGNTAGRLGWLIDTRGIGGYVVAPGSTVHGKPYRISYDTDPAPLPAWIHRLLNPPPRPSLPPRPPRETAGGTARLAPLLEVVLDAKVGERNGRLYWAALRVFAHAARGETDTAAGAAALLDAALRVGLSEREAQATLRSAYRNARSVA
jgi:hypothetical protein